MRSFGFGADFWSHDISREFQRAEASLDWVAVPWDHHLGGNLGGKSLGPQDAHGLLGICIFNVLV